MGELHDRRTPGVLRAAALLVLGVLYLLLVASAFIFPVDLASGKAMQYALHAAVILTAPAYVLFADAVYGAEGDRGNGRPALIFAAMFAVPVLAARGVGIAAISFDELYSPASVLNFYAPVSVTRTVELAAWTTCFPLSMVFLARVFFRQGARVLAWLCALSAACCFAAFPTLASPSLVFLFIGIMGWGVLFLAVAAGYLALLLRRRARKAAPLPQPA